MEGRPLLKVDDDDARHGVRRRRCRRICIIVLAVAFSLALVLGILIAFLAPRVPGVRVTYAGLRPGINPPRISVAPTPSMLIPMELGLTIANDNFYELRSLNTSWVAGFYASKTLGEDVMLGRAMEAAGAVGPRSVWSAVLNVDLVYAFFASPIVLTEIAEDCTLFGNVNITLQLSLHVSALFLHNATIQTNVETTVQCSNDD